MTARKRVVLSLISHTNVGKTTLTRTLLKREVGEVRDEAHVTEENQSYTLLQSGDDKLVIWDTPGFGFVGNILKRVRQEGGAFGWIMHEVVDRIFNRPLYCSLQATRNVREKADVVLYLVNVQEKPEDAGYVELELQLLNAIGKPVIMLLNQVREHQLADGSSLPQVRDRWKSHFASFECLKEVLLLDAFHRTWHQELHLIDTVMAHLGPCQRDSLKKLRAQFIRNQNTLFAECSLSAARTWWFAAHQEANNQETREPKKIFVLMISELQTLIDEYLELLADRHTIESEGRARFKADIQQITGLVGSRLHEKKSGLLAGALTSAGTGLAADIMSGGLTFGGGALLGFLGGYLSGISYAKILNMALRKKRVAWNKDTLLQLYQLLLSYYLLAALHGRGKGKLNLQEPADYISRTVEQRWPGLLPRVESMVEDFDTEQGGSPSAQYQRRFTQIFEDSVRQVLETLFPISANTLAESGPTAK